MALGGFKLGKITVLLVLAFGVGIITWKLLPQKPDANVSVTTAQAESQKTIDPEAEAIRKEFHDPLFADQTGYLEVVKGETKNKTVWIYSVLTPAGPVQFAPVEKVSEELKSFHGSLVRIRESKAGYVLRNSDDDRHFQFELVQAEEPKAELGTLTVIYSPVVDGPKTKKFLKQIGGAKLGPFVGPKCLSENGFELYPAFENALMQAKAEGAQLGGVSKFVIKFVTDDDCSKKTFTTMKAAPYFAVDGIQTAHIVWTNDLSYQAPSIEVPETTVSAPFTIEPSEFCDALTVKITEPVTTHDVEIMAHQVGVKQKAVCNGAVCTISNLDNGIPYLISIQAGKRFYIAPQGVWTCADPTKKHLQFVKSQGSKIILRTEYFETGSQIQITAFGENAAPENCLATVNAAEDGVGLARCAFENLKSQTDYVIMAQYEKTHAWDFITTK